MSSGKGGEKEGNRKTLLGSARKKYVPGLSKTRKKVGLPTPQVGRMRKGNNQQRKLNETPWIYKEEVGS